MYICVSKADMITRCFTLVFVASFIVASPVTFAQSKADKKMIKQLQADIGFLASDSLEGRRTGTKGEQIAAAYIEQRYQQMKIAPYRSTYYHPFRFTFGKEVNPATRITINNVDIHCNEDGFPMPFSANKKAASDILPDLMEQGSAWMLPIYASKEEADNPHFDWEKAAFEKCREAAKQGATAVIFFDGYGSLYEPSFNRHTQYEPVDIPVVFITNKTYKRLVTDRLPGKAGLSIYVDVNIAKTERSSYNLAAYIDNNAKYTVVLGAHYDHLGYGEDHNSLHANAAKEHLIHNGADDNASGTAALLEMARWIKNKKLKNYNYLFVNFSGEELGLYGSKAFVKEEKLDSNSIAYMINMDMVGRLNDSTHGLTLGGVGTSPSWADAVTLAGSNFKLVIDSAGVGPSDHTSFYNAGIPVLFLFTGTHKDYHKPSDKADLINYPGEVQVINYVSRIVARMDKEKVKPKYTVTKQATAGKARFKVSLGIMPDYTFDAGGVRVDGVTENRPAIKAGVKAGDIITRLGEHKISGMQSYMEALGKLSPGQKTEVSVLRDGKEIVLPLELNK
jgi:aminopeptidase YwaD